MAQVFVSYATEDAAIARQVADGLRAAGIGVWIAPESIKPGEAYNEAIVAGLRACDVLAVLVSAASNASKHVVREVGLADGQGKRIVPIRIEPVEPSDGLTYYLSLPQWVEWHSKGAGALGPMIALLGGGAAPAPLPAAPPVQPVVQAHQAGGGVIRVHRPVAGTYAARMVALLIDGEKVGEVGNGKTVELSVPVGRREIAARVDYVKSKPLALDVAAGRPRVLELEMPEMTDIGGQLSGLLGQSKFFGWKVIE